MIYYLTKIFYHVPQILAIGNCFMSNPERFIGIKNSNKLVVWALVWERVWARVWAQIWALVRVQVWMWAQSIVHIYIHICIPTWSNK